MHNFLTKHAVQLFAPQHIREWHIASNTSSPDIYLCVVCMCSHFTFVLVDDIQEERELPLRHTWLAVELVVQITNLRCAQRVKAPATCDTHPAASPCTGAQMTLQGKAATRSIAILSRSLAYLLTLNSKCWNLRDGAGTSLALYFSSRHFWQNQRSSRSMVVAPIRLLPSLAMPEFPSSFTS
jgi:hypothetical protein